MTDPISDMLTRIRNAAALDRREARIPYSKIKEAILTILKANGYVSDFSVDDQGAFRYLMVQLQDGAITSVSRISKPGRRVYSSSRDIPQILSGRGLVIVSTPSGLMSGQQAKKSGLGGELICKVW